jgi:hypothetical protein
MRHVLKRILGLENQNQAQDHHTSITDKSTKTINDNLEATLVIVDAMGNAQTRNNTDSSRMVKVIQVSYTITGLCCLSIPDLCSSRLNPAYISLLRCLCLFHRSVTLDLIRASLLGL